MNFSSEILNYIRDDSLSCAPAESCGLLVETANQHVLARSCRNLSDNKEYNFFIAPSDYVKCSKIGQICGIYHSHTRTDSLSSFSTSDYMVSQNHHLHMILYLLLEDKFLFLEPRNVAIKYIGRQFKFGQSDCLSLVEEFYRNEFRISLPRRDRDDTTMNVSPNLMVDNIASFGFEKISPAESKKYGDIILCKGLKSPSHLMIYIGNNQVLHHRYNKYSNIENYGPLHKQQTYCVVRHKLLWN